MKKKKIIILSILVIFIIAMICGVIWYFNNRNSNYKPNGKLNYDTVLVNEETNPYYQVGFADYVFIGKVDKEIERTFSDYGSARTIYEIEVTENLKGDLQNIIKVTYPGGYDKDGTLILHKGDYITDEELPKKVKIIYLWVLDSQTEQYYYKIYILILHIQKKIKKNTWTILIIKRM